MSLICDTLSPSDCIVALSPSFSGRIFSEPFKKLGFTFSPDQYLNFCRFFLGLPPATTIGGAKPHLEFDYPVQKCLADHGVHVSPALDACADHASSGCPGALRARFSKHTNVTRVLVSAATEAGLATRTEPDTYSVLLGDIPKADCRRVFPKVANKAYKKGFQALSQAVEFVSSTACSFTPEEKQSFLQTKIDALPLLKKGDATGLRLDAWIENLETGELKFIDVTGIHTSSSSYRDTELKFIVKKKLDVSQLLPDVFQTEPSPF